MRHSFVVLALSLLVTSSSFAQAWPQEWNFLAEDLPAEFSADLPQNGIIQVQQIAAPPKFSLELLHDSPLFFNQKTNEFRAAKGPCRIRVSARPNLLVKGQVKLTVSFQPDPDPSEPQNDNTEGARSIPFDEPSALSIFPTGESDHFQLTPPGPGYILIDAPDAPSGLDLFAEIQTLDGEQLGINSAQITSDAPVLVKLTDRFGEFGSPSPFHIQPRFIPEIDPQEPNHSPEDAFPLQLGSWNRLFLLPSGDQDFFAVDIPKAGTLQLELPSQPFPIALSLIQRKHPHQVLAEGNSIPVSAGRNILRISAKQLGHSSMEAIPFQLIWRPAAKPQKIPPDLTVSGRIYSLNLHSEGESSTWNVRTSKVSIVWFHAKPLDSKVTGAFDENALIPGPPYWLRGRGNTVSASLTRTDEFRQDGLFHVWTDVETETDPSEPNDTAGEAPTLPLGSTAKFALYPSRDMDWFSLKVGRSGQFQIEVQPVDPSLDLRQLFPNGLESGLTDRDGSPLIQRIAPSADGLRWLPAPFELKRGQYRIWLRGRNQSNSKDLLQLSVFSSSERSPLARRAIDLYIQSPSEKDEKLINRLTPSSTALVLAPAPQKPLPSPPSQSDTTTASTQLDKSSEPKPKKKWLKLLGIGMLTIFAIMIVILLTQSAKPRKVIDLTG